MRLRYRWMAFKSWLSHTRLGEWLLVKMGRLVVVEKRRFVNSLGDLPQLLAGARSVRLRWCHFIDTPPLDIPKGCGIEMTCCTFLHVPYDGDGPSIKLEDRRWG